MPFDERLARKGRKEPLQGLVDQGRASAEVAGRFPNELLNRGWTAEETKQLLDQVAALDTETMRVLEVRSAAHGTTDEEGVAITESKELIGSVRALARQLVRKNPNAGVKLSDLQSGKTLERDADEISAFLGKLIVSAKKLDAAAAKHFEGKNLSELLTAAKSKLDTASAKQVAELGALPDDTKGLYELKGRLLEEIEDLNAIAKVAFRGQATKIGQFNKDVLLKARSKHPEVTTTSTSTPGTSTTTP